MHPYSIMCVSSRVSYCMHSDRRSMCFQYCFPVLWCVFKPFDFYHVAVMSFTVIRSEPSDSSDGSDLSSLSPIFFWLSLLFCYFHHCFHLLRLFLLKKISLKNLQKYCTLFFFVIYCFIVFILYLYCCIIILHHIMHILILVIYFNCHYF